MEKKIPMRMCIACRTMKPKREMLRIVKSDDRIFLDKTGKLSGRGAYICNDLECLAKCCKNKLVNRTFECNVSSEVYDAIKEDFLGKSK